MSNTDGSKEIEGNSAEPNLRPTNSQVMETFHLVPETTFYMQLYQRSRYSEEEIRRHDLILREHQKKLDEEERKIKDLEQLVLSRNCNVEGLENRVKRIEEYLSSSFTLQPSSSYQSEDSMQLEMNQKEKDKEELLQLLKSHFYPTRDEQSEPEAVPEMQQSTSSVVQETSDLYIFGGIGVAGIRESTVEKFLPESKLWNKVNKLPTNDLQTHPTAVSFDHRNVFLFPSLPSETKRKNLIFKFDANANKKEAWTEINSELNLYLGSYAKLKDDIFIIGGFFHMHPVPVARTHIPIPDDFSSMTINYTTITFNPSQQSWSFAGTVVEPKIRPATVSLNENVIYSLGGLVLSESMHLVPTKTVEKYDKREGKWRSVARMKTRRALFSAVALNNITILALGGITSNITDIKDMEVEVSRGMEQYDARMDSWIDSVPMANNRHSLTAHLLNDTEVHIVGGLTRWRGRYNRRWFESNAMDIYDTGKQEFTNTELLAGKVGRRHAHASCLI